MNGQGGGGGGSARPGEGIPEVWARKIRLVILDVDGVLTDGGIYVGGLPEGENLELKRFNVIDGLGVRLLQWAGIEVAVVSGRVSQATAIRARELDILECHQDGGAQKVPAIADMLRRKGLDWDEVAMLGDDLPDLPVLRRVGFPVAVANAEADIREVALWQTTRRGGQGVVREFAEALLRARGDWDLQVARYVDARNHEDPRGSTQ
jgi:3-deoxy-D-manno-octulosonate 8-phosphate phosphatase (KDO 8-P phosphatase)